MFKYEQCRGMGNVGMWLRGGRRHVTGGTRAPLEPIPPLAVCTQNCWTWCASSLAPGSEDQEPEHQHCSHEANAVEDGRADLPAALRAAPRARLIVPRPRKHVGVHVKVVRARTKRRGEVTPRRTAHTDERLLDGTQIVHQIGHQHCSSPLLSLCSRCGGPAVWQPGCATPGRVRVIASDRHCLPRMLTHSPQQRPGILAPRQPTCARTVALAVWMGRFAHVDTAR
mmetsp:Transcript_29259/g.94288  ORF Transcript_29259/g.94288 Transcript_29259/m.94288 type:complete len:226 (-) Transcript_29259:37-714(-)